MVLQKLVQQHRKNLPYLGSQMNKPGYLDEVKSLISEFMQYDIREEELQDMLGKTGEDSLLHMKIRMWVSSIRLFFSIWKVII